MLVGRVQVVFVFVTVSSNKIVTLHEVVFVVTAIVFVFV